MGDDLSAVDLYFVCVLEIFLSTVIDFKVEDNKQLIDCQTHSLRGALERFVFCYFHIAFSHVRFLLSPN